MKCIMYKDQQIELPTGEDAGPVAKHVWNTLMDVQYGKIEHPWSVVI